MLNWVKQFNIFCYLDSHNYQSNEGYECLLAVNAVRSIDDSSPFQQIDQFLASGHWYFGHLSYDLKNVFYPSLKQQPDRLQFPLFYFFEPEVLIKIQHDELIIESLNPDDIYKQIIAEEYGDQQASSLSNIKASLSKDDYVTIIKKLQQHILRGDCYEINFCQQFYEEEAEIDPITIYQKLIALSPTPFSALYKFQDSFLISASPERFLKKTGDRIFSEPMKGTMRRSFGSDESDEELKQKLYRSPKERAENVMIVDLVRNDLSRICNEGTVMVDELFGVYTFPQVHQMISTVSGKLNKGVTFSEIIKATFPMGSMTGAPKQRVMELIDQYEPVARGLFSGSVGYIDPAGDFDFNVVIRSILYNQLNRFLAYYVGSGITFYSDAEREWEECLLKGSAIKKVLSNY